MKLIAGYIVIFLVFLIIKVTTYLNLQKTTGVVVGEGHFTYGSARASGRRAIIPYPIAKFKGPLQKQKIRRYTYKPEDQQSSELVISNTEISFDSASQEGIDSLISKIVDASKGYVDSFYTTDEYLTSEPTGGYFFKHYKKGETIDIVYDYDTPDTAIVNTFFSYWLTLPALSILIFLSIAWTGIYNILAKRYS